MRRRLYFVLPNVQSAQKIMSELMLSGVRADQIHFVAGPSNSLGNLPVANFIKRSHLPFSTSIGMITGIVFGFLAGSMAVMFPSWFGEVSPKVIPYYMVVGGVFCALWAGILTIGFTSHRISKYKQQIDQGKVLMIVAVPLSRQTKIRDSIIKNHPEAVYDGPKDKEQAMFS